MYKTDNVFVSKPPMVRFITTGCFVKKNYCGSVLKHLAISANLLDRNSLQTVHEYHGM